MRSNLGSKMSNGSHASCYRILYQLESLILPASACMPPDPSRPCQKEKKTIPPDHVRHVRHVQSYSILVCFAVLACQGWAENWHIYGPSPILQASPDPPRKSSSLFIHSIHVLFIHEGVHYQTPTTGKKMLLEVMYLRGGSQATTTIEATSSRALKRRD